MEFEIDTSLLNLANDPDKISLAEISSVHINPRARLREIKGYPRALLYTIQSGYSEKKRILLIVSRILGDKRQILEVQVADEDDIDEYYCGG